MSSKKLTKQKREELKAIGNKSNQSNLLLLLTVLIIVIVVIAAAFMFLLPENEDKVKDDNDNNDTGPEKNDTTKNHSPIANVDYAKVEKNSVNNSIDVLANDTDADGDNLTISSVKNPDNGNASIVENKIVYSPDFNFTGYDIFSYTVNDGNNNSASSFISVFVYDTDDEDEANPIALINTSKGMITVELYEDEVPNTVQNFINYANDGFYDGLIFHRVIDGFMIQGGGFYSNGTEKQSTYGNIEFETHEDLTHVDGALSMASTGAKAGGTNQFFICDGTQHGLDDNYAVFGQTIDGMDVVREISAVETTTKYNYYQDWPVDDVIIDSITIIE